MGTHPIFESDFDCLTVWNLKKMKNSRSLNRPLYKMTEGLFGCGKEALIYGDCVAKWDDVRKGDCQKEFEQFKRCYSQILRQRKK